jgi:hypothetical protein
MQLKRKYTLLSEVNEKLFSMQNEKKSFDDYTIFHYCL